MPASLVVLLAQAQPPAPGADRGEEFGKTSPIALVVILLLGVATFLLIRSMTKRLRNVPASFDPPGSDDEADAGPDGRGPAGPSSGPVDSPSPGNRAGPEG
ncbi:hypothetical protein GCM10023201_00760 [Actinomycetospora corticicola]|uniref:Uncharacterized protein n=1 Tax=Actinomycetospora corticicola TaxID=663602 RepID=A0A7Y9E1D3_9PSEU|nr:hypothetical protein [Actinomycetospora corticicola]NYD39329.1 hypothetical protein [Actinomycetospora corticicola]